LPFFIDEREKKMNVEEAIVLLKENKIKFDDLPEDIKLEITTKMINGEI
jgi:hypothetical protein